MNHSGIPRWQVRNERLAPDELAKLRRFAATHNKVAARLGMGDETFRQLVSGGPVRSHTLQRVRAKLAEFDSLEEACVAS